MASSTCSAVTKDADDMDLPETELSQLCWRMDPEESLSDWKIEISSSQQESENTQKTKKSPAATYYTHRSILAVGSHRSEYFARLFRNGGRFAESADSTSRIELHPRAAAAFPKLLDYFYTKEVEFDEDSVAALHHLGEYFEVKKLRWDARAYLKGNLTLESSPIIYKHAAILQDGEILETIKDFLVYRLKECQQIPVETIQGIAEPHFWSTVMEKAFPQTPTEEQSRLASVVVSYVVKFGKEQIGKDDFDKLTNKRFLPIVDEAAACQLLEACSLSCHWHTNVNEQEEHVIECPSCLECRCVHTLISAWNEMDLTSMDALSRLKRLRPELLAEVLSQVTATAQKDMAKEQHRADTAENELVRLKSRLKVSLEHVEMEKKRRETAEKNHQDFLKGMRRTQTTLSGRKYW